MHRIDAEIARAHLADDGVEVRPVAIDITARRMDRVGYRLHVALEQAASVGVGDHHTRNVRPEPRLERLEIDTPFGSRRDILNLVACKGSSGGIGAMCAFGHQDNLARIAARLMRSANAQYAAQLAMRTRLGAHRDAVHAGQFDQPVGEFVDHLQRAADGAGRLQGVDIGKAGHPRDFLVEARIVLHRAAAEREQAKVDGVVLAAETSVVTHRLAFLQRGQADRVGAVEPAEAIGRIAARFGQVDPGLVQLADFEQQRLFQHQRAIAGHGCWAIVQAIFRRGHFGLPAGCVGIAHASTS